MKRPKYEDYKDDPNADVLRQDALYSDAQDKYIDYFESKQKEVAKIIKKRIKELQNSLIEAKKERSIMGGYDDCGDFYESEVIAIEAKISELIRTNNYCYTINQ